MRDVMTRLGFITTVCINVCMFLFTIDFCALNTNNIIGTEHSVNDQSIQMQIEPHSFNEYVIVNHSVGWLLGSVALQP